MFINSLRVKKRVWVDVGRKAKPLCWDVTLEGFELTAKGIYIYNSIHWLRIKKWHDQKNKVLRNEAVYINYQCDCLIFKFQI